MVLKSITKKLAFMGVLITLSLAALNALEAPALTSRVMDKANIISTKEEREITEYLENLEKNTGIQIAVLTIKSLQGESLEGYSIKVVDKWKLGDKKVDNGALLLVAMDEHAVRIEVGNGLEGSLTDAKCGLIIRNVIIPEFKNGNYSGGIAKGVKNMGGIASNDESVVSKSVLEEDDGDDISGIIITLIIWVLFIFWSILSSRLNRRRGRRYYNRPIIYTNHMGPTYHSSSHSSGFGGFSGGGGHFSGGGASGHW